jgi:hypothetical protein
MTLPDMHLYHSDSIQELERDKIPIHPQFQVFSIDDAVYNAQSIGGQPLLRLRCTTPNLQSGPGCRDICYYVLRGTPTIEQFYQDMGVQSPDQLQGMLLTAGRTDYNTLNIVLSPARK